MNNYTLSWEIRHILTDGQKKRAHLQPHTQVVENPKSVTVLHPCQLYPQREEHNRSDNHYTDLQTLSKEVSTFAYGIKSCNPLLYMSAGLCRVEIAFHILQ